MDTVTDPLFLGSKIAVDGAAAVTAEGHSWQEAYGISAVD